MLPDRRVEHVEQWNGTQAELDGPLARLVVFVPGATGFDGRRSRRQFVAVQFEPGPQPGGEAGKVGCEDGARHGAGMPPELRQSDSRFTLHQQLSKAG
jgi:hypothetical protein